MKLLEFTASAKNSNTHHAAACTHKRLSLHLFESHVSTSKTHTEKSIHWLVSHYKESHRGM